MAASPAPEPPGPAWNTSSMDAQEPLERAYREEATRIRAVLAARTGDVGLAEDAVQDAFVEAMEHWPRDGVPSNPGGCGCHQTAWW